MSKKSIFIKRVEQLFEDNAANVEEEAFDYLETLKNQSSGVKITEAGKSIVGYMQKDLDEFDNKFLARDVAEGLFVSSRSVSGAMRKLVNDGYVSKSDDSPILYSLTEKGLEFDDKE